MYANLIIDVELFKLQVKRYRTNTYDPKSEWFETMNFSYCSNCEFAYNSKFEHLLLDLSKCNEERKHRWNNELDVRRQQILGKLVTEFVRIHADANDATDKILRLLDDILYLFRANKVANVDGVIKQIHDEAWKYLYLCGICEEFATILHGKGSTCRLKHFYEGSDPFYAHPDDGINDEAGNEVRRWCKCFSDRFHATINSLH